MGKMSLESYDFLVRTLAKNDLRELLKCCSSILGRPVMLMSADYCWAIVEPQRPIGDIVYDSALKMGMINHEFLFGLEKLNCVQTVEKSTNFVYLSWGLQNQYPRAIAKLIKNSIIEGYFYVPFPENDYVPEMADPIMLMADMCLLLMETQRDLSISNGIRNQHNQMRSFFMKKLLDGQITDREELNEWRIFSDLPLPEQYVVGVSLFQAKDAGPPLKEIKQYIDEDCQEIQSLIFDQGIYFLFSGVGTPQTCVLQLNNSPRIKKLMTTDSMKVAFSNVFSNLLEISTYKQQAETAYLLGMKKGNGVSRYFYSDHVISDIFSIIKSQTDYRAYLHPVIELLKQHDQLKGSEYLDTLKCYVMTINSKLRTMEQMHIHRNTLDYRLNKIEDITAIDLSDPRTYTHLLCSFLIMDTLALD